MTLLTPIDPAELAHVVDGLIASGQTVAVALTDLDGFGLINENYDTKDADGVLLAYQRTLTGSLPSDAVVMRLGGDEFGVALVDQSAESALIVLDEIRAHLAGRPATVKVKQHIGMTAGIAARPPHATTGAELIRAADQALHRAKRDGGGRIAIYVEEKMVLKSNYYPRASLERLAKLSAATDRTEASLLREALDTILDANRELT
jgi:diguanylate cyclase (GGDEF)-like protein